MRSLILSALLATAAIAAQAAEPTVDYIRDVKPILADRCYACHGPDAAQRKAKLRLDDRAVAVKIAIVAGNAEESPLFQRVSSDDPKDQMPPPVSKKPHLNNAQVQTIKAWINQGAKYDQHWAYVKSVRPDVPKSAAPGAATPIDQFVALEHTKHQLTAG